MKAPKFKHFAPKVNALKEVPLRYESNPLTLELGRPIDGPENDGKPVSRLRNPLPCLVIFVHGVNSEGEWYNDAERISARAAMTGWGAGEPEPNCNLQSLITTHATPTVPTVPSSAPPPLRRRTERRQQQLSVRPVPGDPLLLGLQGPQRRLWTPERARLPRRAPPRAARLPGGTG
ncbi:T6SS effector phospholipase Tle3 domain-containing protein [Ralstonia solanacearum]|uniref:T6SS effector phospholipase Tle3 domain-containing protein n=1 Tax=Ralstonia solanacearum TaxID=305 RepID=UPI003BF830F1